MKLPLRALLLGLALAPLCLFAQSGCTNPWACNYDPIALSDDGSCDLDTCAGCTVSDACNFNPGASRDDGSCDFSCITGCTYGGGCHLVDNYDPEALIDDGSCLFDTQVCLQDLLCDGSIDASDLLALLGSFGVECSTTVEYEPIPGNTGMELIPMALPVTPTTPLEGVCDHPQACNYDPTAMPGQPCDFSSCHGCAYAYACNYDPEFEGNYHWCSFDCTGCTYSSATNYNPAALINDGSCLLLIPSVCAEDLDGSGIIDTADILHFMGAYGTDCDD